MSLTERRGVSAAWRASFTSPLWSRPKACDCVSQSTELSGGRRDFRGGGMPVKKASIFLACSQGFLLKVELPMDLPSPSKETSFLPKGWPRARGGGPRGGAISFASSKTQSCSPGGNAGRRTMATGRGAGFGVLRPVRRELASSGGAEATDAAEAAAAALERVDLSAADDVAPHAEHDAEIDALVASMA